MKIIYTRKFRSLFEKLPRAIKNKFSKQLQFLFENISHPSLQIKKIQGHQNVWEARVDLHYRFTFQREGDLIILRVIGNHDDVLRNP